MSPSPAAQQAELISHQLHEIQRLEAELAGLRAAALQQEATVAARESTVACLQGELEQLRGRSQAEGEALRAELEEQKRRGQAEVTALKAELEELRRCGQAETNALRAELEEQRRRGQAEADTLRAELEVAAEQHQQELLSRLCQAHGAEVGSLWQRALQLEQELEARGREHQSLLEQLSTAQVELASQQALLQQLRTYVGEQGSGLGPERQQLLGQMQCLEGERDALRTTAELLQLRLALLSDILALQELELTRKPCDPLQPEPAQKSQSLLSRWREKVFALMVQLRSQELGHADATNLLQRKVSELQGEVESRDQKVALLLHSLQDKAAEADMERVNNKRLRAELSHQEDSGQRLQRRAEAAEGSLQGLVEIVSRLHQQVGGQEAELKAAALNLAGLGNRVTFAAKRVDTIQGLVSCKVAMARLQRDEQPKAAGSENDGLSHEALRAELALLHQEQDPLQEKVTEVETRLRRDLSELEQRLGEARREHTKAVVALRQAERQAARDRARSQELARLQEEAKREETGRLGARLQALERDKNLLLATLRQEGLLAQYKRNRLVARRNPGEPVGPGQQPPPGKGGARPPSKGSPPRRGYAPHPLTCYDLPPETLAAVLDDLQSLSTALLREEEEETPPGEEGSAEDEEGPP
ncbi:coiled-coil alpha-helical rod protein 1-like [Mauremys mutica]|uniref:coiled-coil alpha-helical rod protein 1-like n=1 Tax=Mauremys mutica TaxID=74926 RepID=UPI001D137099|nr:coiled-coil alpha-helical rod protein 1-like [Mauremys mutica]